MTTQEKLDFNTRNIDEFRSTGGTLRAFGDAPVLLLTTTGSKSGERRTAPMMYRPDPEEPGRVFVFASAAGAAANPAWFVNLVTHPDDVEVELGRETFTARPEVLAEADRARVFDEQARDYPGFAGYQAATARPIPVIGLELRPAE